MAGRAQITAFTGLRGIAAWWVVLYHFLEVVPVWGIGRSIIRHGPLAVDLFFVMSGFVISLSYARSFGSNVRLRAWISFIVMRLGRIYPLHLVILTVYVSMPLMLMLTHRPIADYRFPAYYFLQSLFLIQNWGFASGLGWNAPAWSISSEFLFYIIFPFTAYATVRLRDRLPYVAAMIIGCLATIMLLGLYGGRLAYNTPKFGTIRCLAECALGMSIFYAVSLRPISQQTALMLITGAAALIGLYALRLIPDYVAMPTTFTLVLTALTQPRATLARLLSSPVPMFLGNISFSTYLVHYFIKDVLKIAVLDRMPNLVVFALYITLVLLASIALHRWIEVPGRNAGRRLAAHIRDRPIVHAT